MDWICKLSKDDRCALIDLCMQVLDVESYQNSDNEEIKGKLGHYRTGIKKFSYYIYDSDFGGSEKLPVDMKTPEEYYKKTMIDVFLSRLNTQNRIYENEEICFPSRLFVKIFNEDKEWSKEYENALKKLINNTKFLVSEDCKFIRLKNIRYIRIKNGKATVITNKGEEQPIYTEVYIKKKPCGYELLTAKLIGDLSLDHETSMATILKSEIKKYPLLESLGKDYLIYKNKMGYSKSDLAKNYYISEFNQTRSWKKKLLKEIIDIYEKLQLVIMKKNYNSSKIDSK